jgi:putative transposase
MARLPRLIVPSQAHYVLQRGLNGLTVFQDVADYTAFLGWLRIAARQFKVAVHAYVLLPGELHLLATPADADGLGAMMQLLGRYYVPYYNQKYGRAGTLWQGRYKTSLIDAEHYLMACCRYIEFAAVRAGLAGTPDQYPWSSYPHHVGMQPDGAITDHALYWALGNTPFQREAAYKELTAQGLGASEIRVLEQAVLKGWPLGSEQFKTLLQQRLKRQVLPAKRGRPFKTKMPAQQA